MRHYCTIFDTRFLPQGLALYRSLVKHSSQEFRLHVLAMDEECFAALRVLKLPFMALTPLSLFEEKTETNMAAVRATRTWQEYCWTCGSNFSERLNNLGCAEITYLDADVFFFSDPEQVFLELKDGQIAIIPHRFPPERLYLEVNGHFNVSWVTFRGAVGRAVLASWAAACRDWCFYKLEDDKFGDQKYLDKWPQEHGQKCVQIQNIGAGAAPWNLSSYAVSLRKTVGSGSFLYLDESRLVFYHFHEFVPGKRLTNYPLRDVDVKLIYAPYVAAVAKAEEEVEKLSKRGVAAANDVPALLS